MNTLLNWLLSKQLRPVLVNWKTSLLGLLILLPNLHEILTNFGGVLQVLVGVADGQTLEVERLKQLAIALGTGTALLFARDSNKSSEASGAELPKSSHRLKLPE